MIADYMNNIISEIDKRITEHPDKLLYAFLNRKGEIDESYTYSEFDIRVRTIAEHLQNSFNFVEGSRILLAYPPGLEMICSFFACVRIGLIPVPVYPPSANGFESSTKKMQFIADDCDSVAVLSTRAYQLSTKINMARVADSKSDFTKIYDKLNWISTDDIVSNSNSVIEDKYSEILFLQYTSGSTNDPKGVIITHENLIDNCEKVVDHVPIGVSWLPQYHDMGLIGYYLFFAIKGGTTYGFSATDFILKPSLWLESISKYKATAISAPNFAFDYCLQEGKITEEVLCTLNLSSLRFIMNAAEPVKPSTYRNFIDKFNVYGLDPNFSFAAYGLAEYTLAVTNYGKDIKHFCTSSLKEGNAFESLSEKSTEIMSCGSPLGNTLIKIVDTNETSVEVEDGRIGEIWISGASKGKGYWNKPDLSNQIFQAQLRNNNLNWLRTGDLGFINNEELFVTGRLKDMIIVRGLNYYPHDIESIIEGDKNVRVGCVAVFSVEENNSTKVVAVIGIKNKRNPVDIEKVNSNILSYFGIQLDEAIFVLARDVAKTSSGKIRRRENKRLFTVNGFDIIQTYTIHQNIEQNIEFKNKENNDIQNLFNSYGLSIENTISLGDSGLDSLKLAEFTHDLKELIASLKFDDLAEELDLRIIQKIAVSELFEIVKDLETLNPLARFSFKKAITRIQNEFREVELKFMKDDTKSIIESSSNLKDLDSINTNGSILVTGGTGFFGPFLIKSLLEQNEDDICVLVRAENEQIGFERLRKAFNNLDCTKEIIKSFEERVTAIPGDLEKYNLGMDQKNWGNLSKNVHTIYHNGALVNYLMDYESMRSPNVNGTNEIIRLATSSRLKVLNYVSTTFIFGWSTKDVLFEVDSNKKMELLDFGYSQSKWVSEKVVEDALNKGLPGRIFRPALISPSIDGYGYNFDISIRLLAFMVKYGVGTTAKNQVSFTPANIGANNIVAISNIDESINKTFHVTQDQFSSMQDITKILSQFAGKKFEHFSLKEFVPEVVSKCKKDDLLFPLLNFLVKSVDNISSMEFKRYDNANYRKYRELSPWGIKDHSLEEIVEGICKFMEKNDIIKTNSMQYEK